jgi:hypothetical protein
MRMVLRGAFSQIGIGLAFGIPAAIGAGKLMTKSTVRRQAIVRSESVAINPTL